MKNSFFAVMVMFLMIVSSGAARPCGWNECYVSAARSNGCVAIYRQGATSILPQYVKTYCQRGAK